MHLEAFECGGNIVSGALKVEGQRVFLQSMKQFADGPVTVSVRAGKRTRTSGQNRYWHGVVVPLFAEHCGYALAEMKEALSLELLPLEITDMHTGEVRVVPGHTSDLSVKAFNELIERAQQLGAEMGIYVPDPNEVTV